MMNRTTRKVDKAVVLYSGPRNTLKKHWFRTKGHGNEKYWGKNNGLADKESGPPSGHHWATDPGSGFDIFGSLKNGPKALKNY